LVDQASEGQEGDLLQRHLHLLVDERSWLGVTARTSPILARYAGVTERLTVSPMASWKPSLAPSRNRKGWFA